MKVLSSEKLSTKSSTKWYAIYVRSRAEKKVFEELTTKGIETFLPLERKLRQWSDRKKMIETPLMPGYLFVKIDYKKRLEVQRVTGVVMFITHCSKPAPIPDYQLETLRRLTEIQDFDLEVTHEKLKATKKVEIIAGPLCGCKGEFVKVKGKEKVGVILEDLKLSVVTDVKMQDLAIIA